MKFLKLLKTGLTALISVGYLLVAGCGGGEGGSQAAFPETSSAVPVTPTQPAPVVPLNLSPYLGAGVQSSEVYVDASKLVDATSISLATAQGNLIYGSAPLYVRGGKIVHDNVSAINNAGYLEVALSKKITDIGAAYAFPANSTGSIALVLPSQTWVRSPGATPAGVHFVLSFDGRWSVSYFDGKEYFYGSGNIGSQTDGITRYVNVSASRNTVNIKLPTGDVVTFTDPRVDANISNIAVFELYQFSPAPVRANFSALWAN